MKNALEHSHPELRKISSDIHLKNVQKINYKINKLIIKNRFFFSYNRPWLAHCYSDEKNSENSISVSKMDRMT